MATINTNIDPTPLPFVPNEGWLEAFGDQCTNAMRVAAKHFAIRRLRGIGSLGGHVDDYAARELVQDALDDTLFGVLTWDPAAKSLLQHVVDAIDSRTRHEYNRVKRFRPTRIDAFEREAERHDARGELEASLRQDREDHDLDSTVFASEVIEQLRELAIAAGDKLAVRFLDAIVAGARSRADIMHFANMSLKTYRNARGRLRRLAEQLDSNTVPPLRKA